jgi:predicted RNase H-like nuclease (RuvC/YqgF family)
MYGGEMSNEIPDQECRHGYYLDRLNPCPYCLAEKDKKMEKIEEENEKLKLHIRKLNDIIASKNSVINRMQHENWDDVTYDRKDR